MSRYCIIILFCNTRQENKAGSSTWEIESNFEHASTFSTMMFYDFYTYAILPSLFSPVPHMQETKRDDRSSSISRLYVHISSVLLAYWPSWITTNTYAQTPPGIHCSHYTQRTCRNPLTYTAACQNQVRRRNKNNFASVHLPQKRVYRFRCRLMLEVRSYPFNQKDQIVLISCLMHWESKDYNQLIVNA